MDVFYLFPPSYGKNTLLFFTITLHVSFHIFQNIIIKPYSFIKERKPIISCLSSGMQDRAFYQAMWVSIQKEGLWQGEVYNRRKNGEIYPEWLTIIAVKSDEKEITH